MSVYILTLAGTTGAKFKLTYKGGYFKKLECVSGEINQRQHEALLTVCPQVEKAIMILRIKYDGRVTWEEVTTKNGSMYTQFLSEYEQWYSERFKLQHSMNGVEGKALKYIMSALTKLAGSEELAFEVFQIILSKWSDQEEFYRSQTELRQINSNLNIILKVIKHGKSTAKAEGTDLSNDFRENFKN
ncbi:MAG: hypothetical protein ABI207_03355 [Crocinitomicaceae bacterium]